MERMVAYCGIVCTECPAYIATQNNDTVRSSQEWTACVGGAQTASTIQRLTASGASRPCRKHSRLKISAAPDVKEVLGCPVDAGV